MDCLDRVGQLVRRNKWGGYVALLDEKQTLFISPCSNIVHVLPECEALIPCRRVGYWCLYTVHISPAFIKSFTAVLQ